MQLIIIIRQWEGFKFTIQSNSQIDTITLIFYLYFTNKLTENLRDTNYLFKLNKLHGGIGLQMHVLLEIQNLGICCAASKPKEKYRENELSVRFARKVMGKMSEQMTGTTSVCSFSECEAAVLASVNSFFKSFQR